jgi:hypothetical protein
MSKARRIELDNPDIRQAILDRLIKSNIIPYAEEAVQIIAEPSTEYGMPW